MDDETKLDLTNRLLEVYPNRFYNKIDEIKNTQLYKTLAYHAKEEELSVVKLVKKLGFERENFYDIKRMREIIENYDFIQNEFSELFNVKRQAISLHFKKSENINYFWLPKNFTNSELIYLKEELVHSKKWEVKDLNTGTKYRLISNFTKTKDPTNIKLSLITVNKEKQLVFFNELKESVLWADLISNDYINFSENVFRKIPALKEKVEDNLESDRSINKNIKQELDLVLKESRLKHV